VSEVEAALSQLAAREDGPFVVRLAREPGRRESRYAHLFSGEVRGADESEYGAADGAAATSPGGSRIEQLEARVAYLETELAELKRMLGVRDGIDAGG
jgi:uncharacterized protein YceH (UPF0502 family)